jgi:Uma2 family endonuclease
MTQLATEHTIEEFLNPPDDKLYELVHGELVEKHMAALAVWVASQISYLINSFLASHDIGWVATEVPIVCFPWLGQHGRRPDVAYFSHDRLAEPTDDPITVAPNLVVEVLSPNDDAIELDVKIEEYFRAGVELIWIVNPQLRTVRLHRADGSGGGILHETDTIDGESVLPGFQAIIRDFFPKSSK